jgi:hypothetical protein
MSGSCSEHSPFCVKIRWNGFVPPGRNPPSPPGGFFLGNADRFEPSVYRVGFKTHGKPTDSGSDSAQPTCGAESGGRNPALSSRFVPSFVSRQRMRSSSRPLRERYSSSLRTPGRKRTRVCISPDSGCKFGSIPAGSRGTGAYSRMLLRACLPSHGNSALFRGDGLAIFSYHGIR